MTSPEVTILTAARNAGQFVGETIANMQAQTFRDWEYIIVDDASEDDTTEVVERFIKQDGRIRLLRRSQPGGPFAAANTGLHEARGRYIVRIDADDLSPVRRIERQLGFLRSHPQFRSCITPWRSFDERGVLRGGQQKLPLTSDGLKWYLVLRSFASHSSFTVERDALLDVGGYRELPAAQDYRMICRLSRLGWLGVIPDVLSFVRRHESRISRTFGNIQEQLGIDVLVEHLEELTGQVWQKEEINALWMAGQARQMPVHEGVLFMERWGALWKDREDLNRREKDELWFLFHYHKWRFLHSNLRSQPLSVLREMARSLSGRSWQNTAAGWDYSLSMLAGRHNYGKDKLEDLLYLL